MSQVTVKYLKPRTSLGMPEFCIEARNEVPRTTWSAYEAAKICIGMGMDSKAASDLVTDAIIKEEA